MSLFDSNFKSFVELLYQAKQKKSYTLVLGSGLSFTPALLQARSSITWKKFYEQMDTFSQKECTHILEKHFETLRQQLLENYKNLAQLIREGYFKAVLTINVDTFLEEALNIVPHGSKQANLTIRGTHADKYVIESLQHPSPEQIPVCLLRGHISGKYYVKQSEIVKFSEPAELESVVKDFLSGDVLVVGSIRYNDTDIARCIPRSGGSIWYVSPEKEIPISLPPNRYKGKVIIVNVAVFNCFFQKLSEAMYTQEEKEQPPVPQHLPPTTQVIKVFYLYSPADEALRERIEVQLGLLRQMGLISEWHNGMISVGQEWGVEIQQHWEEAQVILLLVSADFISSRSYDLAKEAVERHKAKTVVVIPIILRPVDLEGAVFSELQVLPSNGQPITSWANRDEALLNVAKGIRRAIEQLTEHRN